MASSAEQTLTSLTAATLPNLIRVAANKYANKIFIDDEGFCLSFEETATVIKTVSKAMIAKGLEHGDRIAIWAPNIHEWIITALAAQNIGLVVVTLNTRYKGVEAAYVLNASQAKLLFCMDEFLTQNFPMLLKQQQLDYLQETVIYRGTSEAHNQTHWPDFISAAESVTDNQLAARCDQVTPSDIADILFTSGTTGEPKGVIASQEQNLRVFTTWADVVGLDSDDRYLVANPFFHSFGFKAGILACLLSGTTLLPHAVFDADEILKRIANERISVLPGAPTLFQSLLAHPELEHYDLSSLKKTTTGAASIPVSMIKQMFDTLGFETVITAYGLTESTGLVTMCRAGDSHETIATTSGRAVKDVSLRIVDTNNLPVATGTVGEIVVKGYNVMPAYFQNEAATKEVIDADGWLHTGDLGCLDEAGNLKITDRLKDMFITGGFNCYPAEIENILLHHDAINMASVIGIPDTRMGEVSKAFIVLKPEAKLTEAELISWSREQMANFKVPRQVRFIEALPLNASGKVLKTALREMA